MSKRESRLRSIDIGIDQSQPRVDRKMMEYKRKRDVLLTHPKSKRSKKEANIGNSHREHHHLERISSCCRSDHFVENISSENYLENPPAGSSSFNCSSSLDDSYSEEIALSSIDKSPETHAEMMMMKKSSSSSETADHRPSKKMILGALSEGGEDPEEWVQEKTRIRKEKNRFLEKRQKRNRDRTHQRTSDLVFRSIQEERDRREQEEEERKSRQEREKRLREEHERRIREEEDLKRVKEEEEERRRRGGKTEERRHNMVQHEQEEGGEEEDDEEDDEEWGGGEAGVVVEETPHQQNQITGMILAQQQRILRGNWCAVGEFSKSVYSQTIFTEAMKKEATTWPGPNYLNYHVEVSWNDRRLLLSWMFDFNVFFGLHSEGLFLSVSTLDRYLEQNLSLPRSRLQLAGLAAMMIAYKFTEKRPRTSQQRISHYLKAAAGQYNARDLLEMEASVLDAINWALNVSTPFCFLERLFPSCVLPDSLPKEDMWFCCLYVAELTICDARILHYLPSIIACSSVYLIRSILGAPSIWSLELEHRTSYKEQVLLPCVTVMRETMGAEAVTFANHPHNPSAATVKFSSPYYLCVAQYLLNYLLLDEEDP